MGHVVPQNRKPAIEQLISNSPHLFVKRDNQGYIHVHYPLASGMKREMTISPLKSSQPDKPYVSVLISDVPENLPPDAPVAATAKLVLKPITSETFEVDQTKAEDVSLQSVLKPIRQGFDLLTTFLADPPLQPNPYVTNVEDEILLRNTPSAVEHYGHLTDPAANTYLNYMEKIIKSDPIPPYQ